MICKNCQTYYVRDPCPNCGKDSTKDNESEVSTGSQVLVQKSEEEEQLVKPSQRFQQERNQDENMPSFQRFAQDQSGEESLVKPSERIRKIEEDEDNIPSFQRFDREATTSPIRSSKIEKKDVSDDIPSFQRYQPDQEVDVSKLNRPEHQEKLKNDKEYRNQVKATLEEVMGLLEKLIDDD